MASADRIPRRIHYIWLSDDKLPELNQRCLDSWRRHMPDYELIRWDMTRASCFDARFVREALSVRAWAFASDYIRLQALASEGGIYLDSDVEVFKPFDPFLQHRAFSSIEYWPEISEIAVEGAVLGAEPNHPWIRACVARYDARVFFKPDGTQDRTIVSRILAEVAAEGFGFQYRVKEQRLKDDFHLYPPVVLTHRTGPVSREETYAIHHCVGAWRPPKPLWKRIALRFIPK
jgi:Glycosyltransferase sugar-binding region containing DXD motif